MKGTISDWERHRFALEVTADLAALDAAEPVRSVDATSVADPDAPTLRALRGRVTSGFGVQLLVEPHTRRAWITVTLNGDTETFEVPPSAANDAFDHPYAYGATLPL